MLPLMTKAEFSRRKNQRIEILYAGGPSTLAQGIPNIPDGLDAEIEIAPQQLGNCEKILLKPIVTENRSREQLSNNS